MRLAVVQTLLVLGAVFGRARSYIGDCEKTDHFQIAADNITRRNVTEYWDNKFLCANMTIMNASIPYSSVVMQYHAWDNSLKASLYYHPYYQYAINGSHIGLVHLVDEHQINVEGYVGLLMNDSVSTNALILYTLLNYTVPVPGACNLENDLENNPNLNVYFKNESSVIVNVTFSEANVGFKPNGAPACQGNPPKHDRLRYDFYIRFLPWNHYSKESQFAELKKMMTVEGIEANGRKIHTFGKNDKPELTLSMFNGRGVIVNIIVWDSTTKAKSAYVPKVVYACGSNHGSLCNGRVEPLLAILYTLGLIVGGAICFVGHRYFLAEVFFFGFLPFTLLSFMIFAANTSLSQPVMIILALVFGIPGGCIWLALWWRFGYVLPIMMWVSFTLGYLLSSIIFFTPFGNLIVWYNSLAYGMAFMCGVMIVPVILIVFTKFLSMLACATWGAYLVVAALSYYSGGVLQYILLNIIHRASIPGYSEAIVVVPMDPVDYFLIAVWFVMIVSGVLVQRRLTRGRRDFPICAYKEKQLLRNQRKAQRNRMQREQDLEGMPPAENRAQQHRMFPPEQEGGAAPADNGAQQNVMLGEQGAAGDDHQPLIVN